MSWQFKTYATWDDAAEAFEALASTGACFPFQRRTWLDAWYAHPGKNPGVSPLPVLALWNDEPALALPLILRQSGGLTRIEYADCGLTDYNTPILGPAAPQTTDDAVAFFEALRDGLPKADIIDFAKMPREVKGRKNPLTLLPNVEKSRMIGNLITVPGTIDEWMQSRFDRQGRKEFERPWRVFSRIEGAKFLAVEPGAEAQRIYDALCTMQAERIHELGLPYILDEPANAAFYKSLLDTGLENGSVILTALTADETLVGALFSVGDGDRMYMLRLVGAGGEWGKCSPGRLIVERTMKHLHAQDYHAFDFTIGDYAYKRRMGADAVDLYDLRVATSVKGLPSVVYMRTRNTLRQNEKLRAFVYKLRGKPLPLS